MPAGSEDRIWEGAEVQRLPACPAADRAGADRGDASRHRERVGFAVEVSG